MVFMFLIVIFLFVYRLSYSHREFYVDYLSKKSTTIVNGLFIMLVFFSHFRQYIILTNTIDIYFYKALNLIGQLMVTTFFFFSGYGIYESIKNKGTNYIKNFFKKRFCPLIINWVFAVSLFVVLNLILCNNITMQKVLLSYVGWDGIGNSNWYIFDIFILYIIIIISFNITNKRFASVILITFLTSLFIIVLYIYKEPYWYNTLLCFPLGMWYSYFSDKIYNVLTSSNKKYLLILILTFILFTIMLFLARFVHFSVAFLFAALLFVVVLSLIMLKIKFTSSIYEWLGKNLFWIYILQRIPMMMFHNVVSNIYIYFIICLIFTVLFTLIVVTIREKMIILIHKGKKV